MRAIKGQLTPALEDYVGTIPVAKMDAYPVSTYRQLVEQIAALAYLNKDHLLFFRGQGQDHRNRAGSSTFYPGIYRGDYLPRKEIINRFTVLNNAAYRLKVLFYKEEIQGYEEVGRRAYIQWGILQHYEVYQTPLIDLTQSLRVACSFAQLEAKQPFGYVYVFGLPYVMNRISHNSEHDIVNVRLLSICPPEALRPYFQEGYLAATEDITTDYDPKTILDFNQRLIFKFEIPRRKAFWGDGFSEIPKPVLYPKGDRIEHLCKEIKAEVEAQLLEGQLGKFIQNWISLEKILVEETKMFDKAEFGLFSEKQSIDYLARSISISEETVRKLEELRVFRNLIVHDSKKVLPEDVEERALLVNALIQEFRSI